MATGHWLTNRGKLKLIQGDWDDAAATDIRIGYLATPQPAGLDTAAEVADINTVADLLALATEATFTNYARTALTRSAATEDDANDRVNMDAANVVIASAGGAVNNTLVGVFVFNNVGANDAARALLSIDWFAAPITTNGGDLTYAIADLYRAS